MKKINEKMIAVDGKMMYAIEIKPDNGSKATFIRIRNGEVYIENSNWAFSDAAAFNSSDEAHSIAKEIFMTQLQCYVKTKIGEIKLLEQVCSDLSLTEVFGDSITKSQELLIHKVVNEKIDKVVEELPTKVEETIKNTVKPKAIKKPTSNSKKSSKIEEK